MSKQSGLILIDATIALALAGVFVAIITESSYMSRDLFNRSRERNSLLNDYQNDSVGLTKEIKSRGNDMTEIETTGFSRAQSLPVSNLFDLAGTPLCSVNFLASNIVDTTTSITPIILPIDPSIPLTDLEVRHGTAYISTDSTKSSDPDIIIADIHDPDNAMIYSELTTGPGLIGLAIAGKRLFAAQTSRIAQLQTIAIPRLDHASLQNSFKLPLPYATATPPLASSIFYDREKIYLGTEKWDGDEFNIIDISNPAQSVKIGGLEIGSKVNDIFVRDGLAYVAASDQKQIRVLDINDASTTQEIASFSPSGWERQEGKKIDYFEDGLFLGRTSGGFNIKNDHEMFSWATSSVADWSSNSNMNSPAPLSLDIPGGVYGIVADRSHIYLATRQLNKELQILRRNLSTSTLTSFPLPVAPQTLSCDNDKLYLLAATAPVIYEISFKK